MAWELIGSDNGVAGLADGASILTLGWGKVETGATLNSFNKATLASRAVGELNAQPGEALSLTRWAQDYSTVKGTGLIPVSTAVEEYNGIVLRATPTTGDVPNFYLFAARGWYGNFWVKKVINGSWTTLGSYFGSGGLGEFTLTGRAVGTSLEALENSTGRVSVTDSALSSGRVGVGGYNGTRSVAAPWNFYHDDAAASGIPKHSDYYMRRRFA